MKLKSLLVFIFLIVSGCVFVQQHYFAPCVNIDDYKKYYEDDTSPPENGALRVTFFGTTTLLIDDGKTQLMTDGFMTRPSLWKVVTSKISTDQKLLDSLISRFDIHRLKAIFAAHSHYDHASDIAYVAKKTGAHVYGSSSTLNIGRGGGLGEPQLTEYEIG